MDYLRKTVFTLSLIFISFTAFSQESVSKPKFQVGLSGLPIIHLDFPQRGFALYGNMGYYLNKRIVAGARPFFGYLKSKRTGNIWIRSLGLNVYSRFYFSTGRLAFFGEVHSGIGNIWEKTAADVQPLARLLWNYAFGPGLDIQLTKERYWNLELLVQYLKMNDLSDPSEFSVGRAVIPTIGLQILLFPDE